jgi:hypothetical protein
MGSESVLIVVSSASDILGIDAGDEEPPRFESMRRVVGHDCIDVDTTQRRLLSSSTQASLQLSDDVMYFF